MNKPRTLHLIACAALCMLCMAAHADEATLSEQEIQAALLDKFIQLVDWPEDGPLPQNVYIVSVLEDKEMYALLQQTYEGHTIHDRNVVFRFCQSIGEVQPSHVVLFSRQMSADPERSLERLAAFPSLTIGYGEKFVEQNGAIAFTRAGDHVRFEVNLEAAERVGVRVSYHLARYASVVHGNR